MKYVFECEFYKTKFVEKDGPTKDWARYLVQLHQEHGKSLVFHLSYVMGSLYTVLSQL